jgi:seryl-tRNA synthetase
MSDIDSAQLAFKQQLFDEKLLFNSGVKGVVGRSTEIVELVQAIHRMIDVESQKDGARKVSFPPVVPRELLRKVGYMDNFPQLCGSIHAFTGGDKEHLALQNTVKQGEDWSPYLSQTDVTLTPAVCYPLYPSLSGKLQEGGGLFDLTCYCFRHEPSNDPARLLSFEMRENVRVGSPEDVQEWRKNWLDRGLAFVESLGLPVVLDTASDPFFGRGGRMMKANQKMMELKFELLVDIWGQDHPTAVGSFNYHQNHFSHLFDIQLADGSEAHTACLGFGIDRLIVGLLKTHGFALEKWPNSVKATLGI